MWSEMIKNNLLLEGAQVSSGSYRFGFIMQQVLGHITAYRNLRRFVDRDESVAPTWTEVTYEEPGGWIERLPLVRPGVKGVARGALQVRGGLRKPYDVVIFNSQSLCLFVRGYMHRVPSVIITDVTPHQYDLMGAFYNHPMPGDSAIARYKHGVNVDVYHSARLIVPWSNWTKSSLLQDYGVPEEKIIVIPPGVDVEQWVPPPDGTREARLAEGERLPGVLFVGGDFQRKGGSLLLDWFLTRGKGRCELHLVTRTPPARAEQLPGLHVYTHLNANDPELMQLYAKSDLFVLPTLADCFGVALIEAMATGLPVVATQVGGVPDIVEDGHQGFLVQPNDEAALADRVERLLPDAALRRRMGVQARARVLAHFDADKNSQRLLELLKALVPAQRDAPFVG
ncbi:MAG TPA: glycosyltransferase family 4 protein [Ktedonobacterales bacterium]|nr:glycosyltransferase family 4 protein [Ktedonobacterales bacterium]